MMNPIQLTVTTCIFGVLGAATTYRRLKYTAQLNTRTRQYVWLITLSSALAAAAFWFLFVTGLDRLPEKWARLVPMAMLIGLALFSIMKPAKIDRAERESTRRIQVGILIGGIALVIICLLVSWPR